MNNIINFKCKECSRPKFSRASDLSKHINAKHQGAKEYYDKWFGIELTELNHKMLYIPEGFAHGFQTLENNSEIFYQMSQEYKPEYARVLK